MSKLLFKLRNVPEDEAQDIRELLEENDISYFETSAGNWGISLPAIWTNEQDRFDHARKLIDEYQIARTEQMRREYQLSKERGEARTLSDSFKESPIKFVVFTLLAAFVLYLSLDIYFF